MFLTLMYITNNTDVALIAEKNGVNRVWIDMETLGKEERQKDRDSVKSHHTVQDVREIKRILTKAELMVRVNPWNENSQKEIEEVISAGADVIMLPMWKTPDEARSFISLINGRTKTCLLLETKEAVECIDQVLQDKLPDEIHIGLNDLHLSYGMDFLFEPLANGMVEKLCKKSRKAGIPYGFGGVAKIGEGDLPSQKIIAEHYRLGSTIAILSRSFCKIDNVNNINEIEKVFSNNMKEIRHCENQVTNFSQNELEKNRMEIVALVQKTVAKKSKK